MKHSKYKTDQSGQLAFFPSIWRMRTARHTLKHEAHLQRRSLSSFDVCHLTLYSTVRTSRFLETSMTSQELTSFWTCAVIVKGFDATSEGSSFSEGVCDAPSASGDCAALSDGCSSLEVAVLGGSDGLGGALLSSSFCSWPGLGSLWTTASGLGLYFLGFDLNDEDNHIHPP